jgi:predicted enzyme related to lactoylglutathione lyase
MTSPDSSMQPKSPTGALPTVRGRFLWHELLVRNRDAALDFYPAVMGWTVQTMNVPGGTDVYTIFANGDAGLAGLTLYPAAQLAGGAPPRWLPYMGTDDAEATYRAASKLGATDIVAPSRIPTVGTIAMLQDPQGAVFALIQPEPAGRPETMPIAGEFAWYEMLADDPEASFEFYRQRFGWVSKHKMDMGKDGVYDMFGIGGFDG